MGSLRIGRWYSQSHKKAKIKRFKLWMYRHTWRSSNFPSINRQNQDINRRNWFERLKRCQRKDVSLGKTKVWKTAWFYQKRNVHERRWQLIGLLSNLNWKTLGLFSREKTWRARCLRKVSSKIIQFSLPFLRLSRKMCHPKWFRQKSFLHIW